ncbi:hypothetical protein AVEN_61906-1 [Araneus ventricosus]|uniref:Uncharacterized protein n=1 Tax=Araneus ventricosus TaxID=182803 RepID=A0A4Y2RTN4_ARAVE|nr:hypothetical protein AVEN_61906-1 [Araneus ventricosus]
MFGTFAIKHSLKDGLCNCIYFLIPMRNLKLHIHEGSAPVHLERFAQDGLDFKFIHLSGSLTKDLPVAAIPVYAYPRLQNKSPHLAGGFSLCERGSLPFSRIGFKFYDRMQLKEKERHWISKLFHHNCQILFGDSNWRRVLVRDAPNGVDRYPRECPAL